MSYEGLRKQGINVFALRLFIASITSRILGPNQVDFLDFVLPIEGTQRQIRLTLEVEELGTELAEPYKGQINRLGAAILDKLQDEIDGGAVDVAVKLLLRYARVRDRLKEFAAVVDSLEGWGELAGQYDSGDMANLSAELVEALREAKLIAPKVTT